MSAQFESEVKWMQHGFAARNRLLGATLARGGYVGIKKVYEREYGGFLGMFSLGSGKEPAFLVHKLTEGLGETWKTGKGRVKPYAAMAATHGDVDCVRKLQEEFEENMKDWEGIKSVKLGLTPAAWHHGGWKAERPSTNTGAQVSCSFVAATQIVDREVTPREFRSDMLERDEVWRLVGKITCVKNVNPARKGEDTFKTSA